MEIREVAAVGLTDESLVKAISTCSVSLDGTIAVGEEILDSFCEILVSNKTPDLIRFIAIFRI
jgi:hypothetical protein